MTLLADSPATTATTATTSSAVLAGDGAPDRGDLVGRAALAGRGTAVTSVVAATATTTRTYDAPDRDHGRGEVVVLPALGESVAITGGGADVHGLWLGLVDEDRPGPRPVVLVARAGQVAAAVVDWDACDARAVVTAPAEADQYPLLHALAATARSLHLERRAAQRDLDELIADAHEYADNNSLCSAFDDFMESHGFPRRTRDHDLTVTVTATLYITRNAQDADDAIESVTTDEIIERLTAGDLDLSITED